MILRAFSVLWTAYAPQMADHLWQSTLFLAVAAVLAFALRKNQARIRYCVWLTASAKFLIPFSLLIALGSHLAKPRVSTPAQVVVYSAVEDFSQPFAGQEMPVIYHPPPTAPAVSLLQLLPAIAVAVWLVGIVVVLLRWVVGWIRISLMVRKAASVREGPEADALRRLESSLGIRTPIRLVLSPDWMEPGIFGIFRPVLIWPEGISKHLDDRHIEAILAHEICHARRHDNLTAVLNMLVETIFWFHPLVWWMGARLEEERERACDEEVSLLCNQPHIYAESILKVCKFCSESPLACVSGITGADLKKRIVQIMTERVVRKLDLGRKLLLLAVGLAVVAVPVVLAQAKATQRMMLAAVENAPKPFRAAAHAMMPLEETPATREIAEVQMPSGADATLAQARAEAKPFAFDVVSIRPAVPPASDGRPRMIDYKFTDDGFVTNSSLLMTLTFQYLPELQGDSTRIVGGPDWVRTIPWEIRARVADSDIAEWSKLSNDPSPEARQRQRATVDAMLAERFKLKTHLESKESAIYALVVSKGGPNLKPAKPDARPGFTSGAGRFSSQVVTLGLVAQVLGHELGRPVIDKTALTGNYAITLNWSPTQGAAAAPGGDAAEASDSAAPSLFTAVQEQLGLKLEAQKGPIETLVIDSAEKPSVDGAEVPGQATQAVPPAPATPSTAIAATWQGTLHAARDQRVVGKITKADDGTLRTIFYVDIDRAPDIFHPISTTLNGSLLKLELPFGTYEGTLGADGNSITGMWRQGSNSQPLNFARATPATEWTIPQPPRLPAMAADANPAFEVATIKPSRPDEPGPQFWMQGRRFSVIHTSMSDILNFAFGVQQRQVAGAPDWFTSERYDISAVPDGEGEPNFKQWQSMVKKLMTDRFQLKFHYEKRELSVYALTVAKGGPKLTRSQSDPSAPGGKGFGPPGNFGATNATVADVADALGYVVVDRPVVDQTGLMGKFDLKLRWTPDGSAAATERADAPPDIFTAIQEQLGLKLVSTKSPVDVLVIDHVERPSAN